MSELREILDQLAVNARNEWEDDHETYRSVNEAEQAIRAWALKAVGEDDIRPLPGMGGDPVRETCFQQGYNQRGADIRKRLQA